MNQFSPSGLVLQVSWAQESRDSCSHTCWGAAGALLHPGIAEYQGAQGSPGLRELGGTVFKSDLPCTGILSAPSCSHLFTAITGTASPSHCSSEMHYLYLPATKNWLTTKKQQTQPGHSAFLLLPPLTPKPFTAHSSFSGSPQLCSADFKYFMIQSNRDKVPPVCNQD